MKKSITNSKLDSREIKDIQEKLWNDDFIHYVRFADTLIRYMEIISKTNISRLQSQAVHNIISMGGSTTPTHLARSMFRSKHSVTNIVDSLEKEGLVIRDFTSRDRRVTYIKITHTGLKYALQNHNEILHYTDKVLGGLEVKERKALVQSIAKLQKIISDILNKKSAD